VPRFQVDDLFYDAPAVSRAGTAAVGLYFRCGVYVARHLLDGRVPSEVATQYGTPEWVTRLTDAGLWETVPGGHFMPLYLADNPSRAQVLAERQRKSERQRRWLEKQRSGTSQKRRVSRPSTRPTANASRDGPEDIALPPSLREGSRARANGATPRTRLLADRPVHEAIAAATPKEPP
jgi:hypothetical protein